MGSLFRQRTPYGRNPVYPFTEAEPYIFEDFNTWTDIHDGAYFTANGPHGVPVWTLNYRDPPQHYSLEDNGNGGQCLRVTKEAGETGTPEMAFKWYTWTAGGSNSNVGNYKAYHSHGWTSNLSGPSQPFNRMKLRMRYNADYNTNSAGSDDHNIQVGTYHAKPTSLPQSDNESDGWHFYIEPMVRHDRMIADGVGGSWLDFIFGAVPSSQRGDDWWQPKEHPLNSAFNYSDPYGMFDLLTYFYISNRINQGTQFGLVPSGYPCYFELDEISMWYVEENPPVLASFVEYPYGALVPSQGYDPFDLTIRLQNVTNNHVTVYHSAQSGGQNWFVKGQELATGGAVPQPLTVPALSSVYILWHIKGESGHAAQARSLSFNVVPIEESDNSSQSPFFGASGYRNRSSNTPYIEKRKEHRGLGPFTCTTASSANVWLQYLG